MNRSPAKSRSSRIGVCRAACPVPGLRGGIYLGMGFCGRLMILLAMMVSALLATPLVQAQQPVEFSDWRETTSFSGERTSHAAVLSGNRLYILGGLFYSNALTLYNDVQSAVLGNDGSIPAGGWQTLSSFPVPRSGLGAVYHKGFFYIVGGYAQSGTLDDTIWAQANPDGSVGAWVSSPHHLNTPRSNLGLQVVTTPGGAEYLLAIAGVGQIGNDTVHFDSLEAAAINPDGSLGQWRSCPFHLKGGRSAPATTITNGTLQVLGGWGDLLEDIFRDAQYAKIRDDGCVEAWHTSPYGLSIPLYGATVSTVPVGNSFLMILLGGNAGQGNYFNNVQFAPISGTGDIGPWRFDKHQFPTPRWGHVSVRYNDFIYVMGGSQRGANGFLNDVQLTTLTHK